MPGVELNGIEFAIKSDTTSAVVSIDRLRKALSKLQGIHISDLGLKTVSGEIKRFSRVIDKLDTAKLDALSKSLRGITGVGNMFGKMADNPSAYAESFQTMTGYLRQMSTIDFTNLETAAKSINLIAASANKIGNQTANGTKETATGFKFLAEHAKKAVSPLSNILASLKRIAFYRIIRSVIKAITSAFQEGLKNAYQFSKATGDGAGLAGALDRLATTSMTMKNQLGAAFGGLLTAITPIVVQIINLVTRLAEALTRLMAILGGSGVYLRAKENWTEWGEAAAGAGGAAKKALEYLAPFDELNVLPDPKSGGGGGGGGTDWGDMFEYVNTEDGLGFADVFKGWFDTISNFFENTDWKELADKMWDGLKTAFSDGGKATEVVRSFSEALGSALGGISAFLGETLVNIGRDLWNAISKSIRDYNGDGKISGEEIIGGILIGIKTVMENIEGWIKTNVVDPFMEGFAKGFGMSGKEELYDALANFGIDVVNYFTQNVINPVISAWNNMVDGLPQWLKDAIKKITGVDTITIPLIGEIDHVDTAGLSAQAKIIKGMTAGLERAQDQIPAKDKLIKSISDVTAWQNNINNTVFRKGTPFVGSVANVTAWQNNISNSTFNNRKGQPSVPSIANVGAWQNNISNSVNGKGRPYIGALANVTGWNNNITNSVNGKGRPFIGSLANIAAWQNNIGTPSINSQAFFNKYGIASNLKDGSNMTINATARITKTSGNIKGTINYTAAKGGALFGGAWHSIPQYASGTAKAGSVFIAGEAGPEVVGHIGGRTEVLNRSQLAATMYSAVKSAMASVAFHVAASPSANYTMSDADSGDALYRAFRRALDETDFGGDIELDGQTLYRAMVNRNRQNTRVTGVNAMA